MPHQNGFGKILPSETQPDVGTAAARVLRESNAVVGQELGGLDTADRVFHELTEFLPLLVGNRGSRVLDLDQPQLPMYEMHNPEKKSPVVSMVECRTPERVGRVKALAAPDCTTNQILGLVHEYILPESTVFTDEYPVYDRLGARMNEHKRINHSAKVYVIGDVHTNTIEGFWSLVKRGIGGVYHQVSQKIFAELLG